MAALTLLSVLVGWILLVRTMSALDEDPGLFEGAGAYHSHLTATLLVVVVGGTLQVAVVRYSRRSSLDGWTKLDVYAAFFAVRLSLTFLLEYFHVRPYPDSDAYLAFPYDPGSFSRTFLPVTGFFTHLLAGAQVYAFSLFSPKFAPRAQVFVPMICRLFSLALETLALYLFERTVRSGLERKVGPWGQVDEADVKRSMLYLVFFPPALVVSQVWASYELMAVCFNLAALHSLVQDDHLGCGVALGLSFATKVNGVVSLTLLGVVLARDRNLGSLARLFVGFVASAAATTVTFWLLFNENFGEDNFLRWIFSLLVNDDKWNTPLFENIWFGPVFGVSHFRLAMAGVTVALVCAYAFFTRDAGVALVVGGLSTFFASITHFPPWWVGQLAYFVPLASLWDDSNETVDRVTACFTIYLGAFVAVTGLAVLFVNDDYVTLLFDSPLFGTPYYWGWIFTGYAAFAAGCAILLASPAKSNGFLSPREAWGCVRWAWRRRKMQGEVEAG
ncbi:MAG: hypothetical protein Kow0069_29700 [Promethearchaeota archaeon]